MFTHYGADRKYRLARKSRFCFIAAVVIACFAVLLCAVVFSRNDTGLAVNQAKPVDASPAVTESVNKLANVKTTDWRLTLVNESHPLPDGFRVETQALPNGQQFDARAIGDLTDMLQAGKEQGLSLVVCSAYRSNDKQRELFDNKVSRIQQEEDKTFEQAYVEAQNTIALPGRSEHNLGLAVDIVAQNYQGLDDGYLDTPECKWLQENSYKFGFIMRYPGDKSTVTKIIFEPWHYRYVGVEAATEIKNKDICLEEYLGMAH